jgi:predicted dinucleotide-binding enzyme
MKITIIGAGNMGRGIATRAIAGGHEVEILDRDQAEAQALADQLGGSATVLEPSAPFGGEIVVFALYYPVIKEAVQQYADRLAGRVVVDITNPVDTETWDRLATPPGSSSAEEVAQLVPGGTPVVKAFNTTFAPTLLAGEVDGRQLDVLIAGDDGGAKEKVSQLVSDGRAEADRRRPARPRAAARAARLPAHRDPAAARPGLRERDQAPSVTLEGKGTLER